MQREPLEFARFVKYFRSPAVRFRRRFGFTPHGVNVNFLAVVAAVIVAELLHAENFTQRRKDAKLFFDVDFPLTFFADVITFGAWPDRP